MTEDDAKLVQVNVRGVPPDVKQRADEEAKRLGFRSITQWTRRQIFELAGEPD